MHNGQALDQCMSGKAVERPHGFLETFGNASLGSSSEEAPVSDDQGVFQSQKRCPVQ